MQHAVSVYVYTHTHVLRITCSVLSSTHPSLALFYFTTRHHVLTSQAHHAHESESSPRTMGFVGDLTQWVQTMDTFSFALVNVVISFLPIPGSASALCLAAGVMFGSLFGTVVYSLSATVGAVVAFQLARMMRTTMTQLLKNHQKQQRALDAAVAKDGFQISLLLRLSPVQPGFQLTSYMLGLTGVSNWDHTLGTLVGLFPCSFAYIYAGSLGANAGEIWQDPVQLCSAALGVVVTLLVTVKIGKVAQAALDSAAND